MAFDDVWQRIEQHQGQVFRTVRGLEFTYRAPGNYLRITRNGREINRSLSRTNFAKAAAQMPARGPSEIKESEGSAYTWAILMNKRIRAEDW